MFINGNTIRTQKHWSGSGVWRAVLSQTEILLPANVQNIHMRILEETGLAWDNWWVVMDKILAPVGEREIDIYGWTLGPWYVMKPADNMGGMDSFGPGFDDNTAIPTTPAQNYEAAPRAIPLLGSPAGDPAMDANSFMPGTPQENTARGNLANWLKEHPAPKYPDVDTNPYGDLNNSAPNEEQIHSYLAQTFELGKKGVEYTPMDFKTRCEYILIRGLRNLEGKGDYALGIDYYAGDEEAVRAAIFTMLIE